MNKNGSIDQSIATWRARLIRLTQVPSRDINGGEPVSIYIDPGCIIGIARINAPVDGAQTMNMTEVYCGGIRTIVTESTDEVARLRDEALGYVETPSGPPPMSGEALKVIK
jgi:hypothetical protein